MNDCSKHKKEVAGITSMIQLADMVGDLHYESLTDFLAALSVKIQSDANKDYAAGREKLSGELHLVADYIVQAQRAMYAAYKISKPFMEK